MVLSGLSPSSWHVSAPLPEPERRTVQVDTTPTSPSSTNLRPSNRGSLEPRRRTKAQLKHDSGYSSCLQQGRRVTSRPAKDDVFAVHWLEAKNTSVEIKAAWSPRFALPVCVAFICLLAGFAKFMTVFPALRSCPNFAHLSISYTPIFLCSTLVGRSLLVKVVITLHILAPNHHSRNTAENKLSCRTELEHGSDHLTIWAQQIIGAR